uniref:Phorbol-ester/DAG-type domain-containing protein n=1 Tax=Rhabditophanes sp. KR3021 TaxID=114890 RepID=A0AC35THZ5_9BILA
MAEEPASPTFLLQYYKQYQESTQIQENITSREPTKIFDESRLFNLNELCLVSSHVFQQWLEAKKEEDLGENEFLNVEDLFPESLFINAEWLVNDLSEIMAQFIELFQDKSNNCTKKGICLSVAYWIKKFPAHFDACPQMFKLVSRGVHMKDLIQLNVVGGFDFVKTGEINLRKFFQLAEVLSHFLGVKKNRHNLGDANHDLINTLKMSFDMSFNEEDLYSLSLKKEPKNLFSFNNNSKTIVFADWASGIDSTPDKEDIQRHTAAMVEAVFKHYDHDKDNSISAEEFQVIVDFMDFNQKSLKLRSGFKHNFHETTFLTPTMCGHCSKLLWGLIRQGYKCKDCGQSVHSHCKDYVVVECRRFPNITPKKTSSTSSSSDIPVDAAEDPKPVYEEIYGTSEKQKKIGRFNYYNKWKSRTVSTVSEAGSLSPEPFSNKASTDDEQNENVNHNRGTSQQKRIQTRMRSETVDYYQ